MSSLASQLGASLCVQLPASLLLAGPAGTGTGSGGEGQGEGEGEGMVTVPGHAERSVRLAAVLLCMDSRNAMRLAASIQRRVVHHSTDAVLAELLCLGLQMAADALAGLCSATARARALAKRREAAALQAAHDESSERAANSGL